MSASPTHPQRRARSPRSAWSSALVAVSALALVLGLVPATAANASTQARSAAIEQAVTELSVADTSLAPQAAVESADPPSSAETVSVTDAAIQPAHLVGFNPANLIDDSVFYNGRAMSAAQIQAFLDQRIGNCQNGRCLNILQTSISSRPARVSQATGNLVCSAINGGTMRVSELIYRVQVACGISARVILVTLEKEQSLVTSRAPSDWNLRAAMGAYCPDSAPCDPAFAGVGPQVVAGVTQLKMYRAGAFARQPGVHFIQYNPNQACGGTNVNVANYATAALYNYTPYQPNAASLRAGYGQGDGCSSYGNRNFYNFFTDWFGSVRDNVDPCREPSSPSSAQYQYVVTAASLNARLAPNTACDRSVISLGQGTIVQAVAVEGNWLKVRLENTQRWISRDHVRRANAAEAPCAIPTTGSAQYVYVVGRATTGRTAPNADCGIGATDVGSGTVVQAVGVNSASNWIKVSLGRSEAWIDRSDLRRATDAEAACAIPVGARAASKTYLVRQQGTTARQAPNRGCGVGTTSVPGYSVVTAVEANRDRDWLLVPTANGNLWIPRSETTEATLGDRCRIPTGLGAASRSYVAINGLTARSAPGHGCADGAVDVAGGTIMQASRVTADGQWLRVALVDGFRWVPRQSVRYATASDTCGAPVSSVGASRTYVTQRATTARTSPNTSCSSGSQSVPAGTVAVAVAANAGTTWLKLALPSGEMWVPRGDLRYATGNEACSMPYSSSAATRSYVVNAGGTTGRSAPFSACATGATGIAAGTVVTASAVTSGRDWLRVSVGGAQVWVPRDTVRYATDADHCAAPTGTSAATLSYVVTAGGTTGRAAPSATCTAGAVNVAAGTIVTATSVTSGRDWLRVGVGGAQVWIPRGAVRYATDADHCAVPTGATAARMSYTVNPGGTTARTAPRATCTVGSVNLSAGTTITAVEVTAERDWLKVTIAGGRQLWVPRNQVTQVR